MKLLFLLMLVAGNAFAATFYVRPASAEYGAENGTSYAAAYDGLADVVASVADLAGTDTVIFCGDFSGEGVLDWPKDGTSAGSRLTLNFDCSASGDLTRAKLVALTGSGNYALIIDDNYNINVSGGDFAGAGGTGAASGSHGIVKITGRTAGVVDESKSLEVTVTGAYIHTTGRNDSLAPSCMNVIGANFQLLSSEIGECHEDAINLRANSVIIRSNYFHDWGGYPVSNGGDFIQFSDNVGSGFSNNLIELNTATAVVTLPTHAFQRKQFALNCDSVAVTSGNIVQDNVINGSGVTGGAGMSCGGIFRRNYLFNQGNFSGSTDNRGIAIGQPVTNRPLGMTWEVYSNIVASYDDPTGASGLCTGLYYGYDLSATTDATSTLRAYNNTFVNILGRAMRQETKRTFVYANNTATLHPLGLAVAVPTRCGTTSNVSFGFSVSSGAVSYYTQGYKNNWYNAYQEFETGSGDIFDSINSEPKFVGGALPTSAAGFRTACGSPLIATGTPYLLAQDYGNRRFSAIPSIGAWEHGSGDARCTVTARTTVTPR